MNINDLDLQTIIFTKENQESIKITEDKLIRFYTTYYCDKKTNKDASGIVIEIKYATLKGIIKDKNIANYFNNEDIMLNPLELKMEGLTDKLGNLELTFKKMMIYEINREINILTIKLINQDFIKEDKKEEE